MPENTDDRTEGAVSDADRRWYETPIRELPGTIADAPAIPINPDAQEATEDA
jgi:hypothetical protein